VLAAQHLPDLAAFDQAGELVDARRQLACDVFALAGPVEEHTKVVRPGLEGGDQLDLLFDAAPALQDFLRLDLIVPEARRRSAGLYLCELITRASGFKDNSGDRRRASQGPDTGGSNHRER
jgi:hypothetical protein